MSNLAIFGGEKTVEKEDEEVFKREVSEEIE